MQLEEMKQRNNGSKEKVVTRTEIKLNDDVRALIRQQNSLIILPVDLK
jgi:hypothetical protein